MAGNLFLEDEIVRRIDEAILGEDEISDFASPELRSIRRKIQSENAFIREKLAEYACASSRGKRHIYLNFALNITKGCDCEPHAMKPVLPDIGLFLSSDPVAVDAACWDAAARLGKSFRGRDILAYAEKCGAGSTRYELIQC